VPTIHALSPSVPLSASQDAGSGGGLDVSGVRPAQRDDVRVL
jgi:hypothetical protein